MTVNKYSKFHHHLRKHTFPKIEAWIIQRRISEKLPTSSYNTNNLVESSFKYVKDIMFNRLRVFNLTEMLSLVLDRSEWYINKVIDAANDRIESWLKNSCHSKYVMKLPNIDPDSIVQLNPLAQIYLVPSETDPDKTYVADMDPRRCTCPQGRLAGPCKHKYLVAHCKNIPSFDVIPTNSSEMRQLYMYLGTGKHTPLSWFLPKQAICLENDLVGTVDYGLVAPLDHGDLEDTVQVGSVPVGNNLIDPQAVKDKLEKTLKLLSDKFMSRIDSDPAGYAKAVDTFEKTVGKLPNKSDSALQKSLCSFAKLVTQVLRLYFDI